MRKIRHPKKYSAEKISLWLYHRIKKIYKRVYKDGFKVLIILENSIRFNNSFNDNEDELKKKHPYFVILVKASSLITDRILFNQWKKDREKLRDKKEKEAKQKRLSLEKRQADNQKVSLF